jgi:hypothetical protein
MVSSVSSKAVLLGALVMERRSRMLVQFSLDCWYPFGFLCAIVVDIQNFVDFLRDCYARSKDALFFVQYSTFTFGYFDFALDECMDVFSSAVSRYDLEGWRLFNKKKTLEVLKGVGMSD